MNNSFNVVSDNRYDRNFGGTTQGVADPYISGYHFVDFIRLPPRISDFVPSSGGRHFIGSSQEVMDTLNSSCLSVTPPGGTLNKAEFTGLGGVKFAVPTNVDYGNTLTMKFLEFSGLPILGIIGGWVQMIRDYRTGVSNLGDGADEYTKQNYAASVLYWTTKPDGRTVEFSALFTGVFPTKDPRDLYTGDFTAVDKLEADIEFNVDWTWHEPWVLDAAQTRAHAIHDVGVKDYRVKGGDGAGDGEAGL